MIGYITLGTNDLEKATAFYDALLAKLDAQQTMKTDRLVFWGKSPKGPFLAVGKPYDGAAASTGNGTMISLAAGSQDQVKAVYNKALELGAKDEGEPGYRTDNFFGAYFRDPDGNKLCVFCIA
ncbi:VOC family protein [Proteobacteria bacterium 005FR1]|nr:VOC family protein [Proteobacteria bacterium 005FR1]